MIRSACSAAIQACLSWTSSSRIFAPEPSPTRGRSSIPTADEDDSAAVLTAGLVDVVAAFDGTLDAVPVDAVVPLSAFLAAADRVPAEVDRVALELLVLPVPID